MRSLDLAPPDQALLAQVTELLDAGRWSEAEAYVVDRLRSEIPATRAGTLFKLELAGLLLDIGSEGQIGPAILRAKELLEKERSTASGVIVDEASYEYNLGNAEYSLYGLSASQSGFLLRAGTVETLTKAKNHYWRAFKGISSNNETLRPCTTVNLANSLRDAGRVTEALQWYEVVLRADPLFGPGHFNRAETLGRLVYYTGRETASLVYEQMRAYAAAATAQHLPPAVCEDAAKRSTRCKEQLLQSGYSTEVLESEHSQSIAEERQHSAYRSFCLHSHLTLSEHALYCGCAGARRDDLSVVTRDFFVGGDFIPRMELVVNRCKAEFGLARLLWYQSLYPSDGGNSYDADVVFTDLFEGESIGIRQEKLRTSFRLCFGILDKLAYGLCHLFSLAGPEESVSFESFWRPRGKSNQLSSAEKVRWEKINRIESVPLVALYSQATDLNMRQGEWKDYKAWRNALEHGLLLLGEVAQDPFSVLDKVFLTCHVCQAHFEERTLHLLQVTRAAIIYFVWAVRLAGRQEDDPLAVPVRLPHK